MNSRRRTTPKPAFIAVAALGVLGVLGLPQAFGNAQSTGRGVVLVKVQVLEPFEREGAPSLTPAWLDSPELREHEWTSHRLRPHARLVAERTARVSPGGSVDVPVPDGRTFQVWVHPQPEGRAHYPVHLEALDTAGVFLEGPGAVSHLWETSFMLFYSRAPYLVLAVRSNAPMAFWSGMPGSRDW